MSSIFLARPEQIGDGTRLAVKDLFDTEGIVTTYGSAIFADHVPARTAEAVRRLEASGYSNVGKTNLHEFAYGVTSVNPHFGTVPNPLAPGRLAGGSSGGSAAALAAGLADVALGSDTGGSIRIPAACCGVVGFKPSYGLVPVDGCFPLAPSLDHAGPMARSVAACARATAALVPGLEPAALSSLAEVQLAVAWLEDADELVRAAVEAAASKFPFRRLVELPKATFGTVFGFEAAAIHRELFAEHSELYGEDVAAKLGHVLELTESEYAGALRRRELYREQVLALLGPADLLLTPTLPCVAPPVGPDPSDALTRFTSPFNGLGWPALALPCGPAEHGLPASVQLVGPAGGDGLVLAAGELLERALSPI